MVLALLCIYTMKYGFWTAVGIAIGATLLASMIPGANIVAPLIGGAVAAYFSRATAQEGTKIGAVGGAIVPIVLFPFLLVMISIMGMAAGPEMIGAGMFIVPVYVLFTAFVAGLGALGGFLGGSYAEEQHRPEAGRHSRTDAVETLKRRYAEGEITEAEFEHRLEKLIDDPRDHPIDHEHPDHRKRERERDY